MYLVDSNVLSELRRRASGKANANVVALATQVGRHEAYINSVVVMELEQGVLLMEARDAVQGRILRKWLVNSVYVDYAEQTIAFDVEAAKTCAWLHARRPRPERDAMIAATALVHDLTVVTRNEKDLRDTGVRILIPWRWSS